MLCAARFLDRILPLKSAELLSAIRHDRAVTLTNLDVDTAARLRATELSYGDVGRTAAELPSGYRYLCQTSRVGKGAEDFRSAASDLLTWQMHLRAGLHVTASAMRAEPGVDLMLRLQIGPFRLAAPCRVVYVVDQPTRKGFAYGTLVGHPERGEESFIVEHQKNDVVTFTINAFSRPATLLAKVSGPIGRAIQTRITSRYLRSLL